MMYEELAKSLRTTVMLYDAVGQEDLVTTQLMKQAADAIEELSHKIDRLESEREISPEAEYAIDKHADNLISHMKELISGLKDKPHWIPVTEPPKEDGWYQVYAPGYSGGSSSGLKNINGNMYSAFKHGKWSIEVGYHKRPGCVKAWMPLPEPPEENGKSET